MSDAPATAVADQAGVSATETRAPAKSAVLASRSKLLEATLSSIPDYVYAFDRHRRFVFANPAMLGLFGLTAREMLGRTMADLGYPAQLVDRLDGHLHRVLTEGVTIEDEVFYSSPTGHSGYSIFSGARLQPTTDLSKWWSAFRATPASATRSRRR